MNKWTRTDKGYQATINGRLMTVERREGGPRYPKNGNLGQVADHYIVWSIYMNGRLMGSQYPKCAEAKRFAADCAVNEE